MRDFSHLPPLREVIEAHNLAAKKSLGQNFLLDLNITRKIARLAGDLDGKTVVEVGPGPGGLTRALLETGATQVIAIEKDARATAALQSLVTAAEGRLVMLNADAMAVPFETLPGAPFHIIANLPYNIGTALLLRWLHQLDHIESMTLMFQTKVVDRMQARVGTAAYGRLSVLVQLLCTVRKLMTLPPGAFTPAPKVHSAVVHLVPHATRPAQDDVRRVEAMTAAAFQQRRKTVRNSLSGLFSEQVLVANNINPQHRAENLSPHDYLRLASVGKDRDIKKD